MQNVIIEGFKLSPQQKHLWSLQPESAAYRSQIAILIEGELDAGALKKCVRSLTERHEITRTAFRSLPGMKTPVQVVNNDSHLIWEKQSLAELKPDEQRSGIEGLLKEERQRPFDFEQGSMLHATLLALSARRHLLLITLPSICADARTLTILAREISLSYTMGAEGESAQEIVQYVQFSQWQNEVLEAKEGETAKAYWREQTAGGLLDLQLPFENHTAADSSFTPLRVPLEIDAAACERIETFVRRHNASVSDFMLACLCVLFRRVTEQEHIIVGYGYDGRSFDELESALGLFAKNLPLRLALEETLSFVEVLRQVQEATREAVERQEYYSGEPVEGTPESRHARSFLPYCFDFAHLPALYSTAQTSFSIYQQIACTDRFKLKLSCIQHDASMTAEFHYDSRLYTPDQISRLKRHFETLIESVLATPGDSIGAFEILDEAERQRLLVEFNDTQADYPTGKCIHQLIEDQALRTPDKSAIVFADQQLTYAELNAQANGLAHHLRELGVRPETAVAICVERSPEMIVGILGILKAGGAYVPLNPELPEERLAFMLKDAGARILLTQERLLERLHGLKAHALCLDADREKFAPASDENPAGDATAAHPAYIIYTSGSTGQPKGVLVTQRNLVHSTFARFAYYREPINSFMLVSPLAFDSSVAGIFWTLCQGGTLALAAENFQQDLTQFVGSIARNRISHLLCIPSLWDILLQHAATGNLDSLRVVIVAGEACSRKLVARHNELLPRATLFNEYGPTETTVWCSVYECRSEAWSGQSPPIGKPISNTQIYILNSQLRPVPIGVAGELHVGGDGVARGYLNRPDLTGTKFINNPFSDLPGARLYKTGDLARYLPDGNIEFLGRLDNQVKIRGFRVEPEEIEVVLKQHPAIREAVVIVGHQNTQQSQRASRDNLNTPASPGEATVLAEPPELSNNVREQAAVLAGNEREELIAKDNRLIAYFVPDGSHESASDANSLIDGVRSFLKEKLPPPMVPSAFVLMKAMPLTPNGKVDRKSLPSPDAGDFGREGNYVAPRTSLERFLVNVWQEVLGVGKVGLNDNFFELGGDSIKGIVLINKVQERLGKQVHVVALLEAPRISDLAAHIAVQHPEAESVAGSLETFSLSSSQHLGERVGVPAQPSQDRGGGRDLKDDALTSTSGAHGTNRRSMPLYPVPREAGARLPLSSAQQRLWFLDRLEPDNAFYNISAALRLRGRLNVAALEQAVNEIVRRHEILRTTFPDVEGQPVQVISPSMMLFVAVEDLRTLPATAQEANIHRFARAEAARPFNLAQGPLLRLRLLRLDEEDYVTLLTMHHIVSDGWSIPVFIRELGALYASYTTNTHPSLPELPIQYADYALWQQHWLNSEEIKAQLKYWQQKLDGELPVIDLPSDRPRPLVQTFRGGQQSLKLDERLAASLRALSLREGATLFMTFLAAFKTLLHRYTGQDDIIVGCPVANRNLPQTAASIGFFVNTLVLRADLTNNPTFLELLSQVRRVSHQALAHQDLPFEKLVEALHPERNLSRTPIFQVMFVQHSDPMTTVELAGLDLTPLEIGNDTSKFDLTMSVLETGRELKVVLEYSADLFEPATIERMIGHYRTLLEGIAAHPHERLSNLPLLTRIERRQVLVDWNDTQSGIPLDRCLHELFEAQSRRTPEAVAVICGGQQVTYSELDAKANQLAHYLQASGVRPEIRVGIMVERSVEMVIALLGVLKAGGAYVPFDSKHHPQERLVMMLEDAGVKILLTRKSLAQELPEHTARAVCLDADWSMIAEESAMAPASGVLPENLAYIIYTSGSTGKPKGVMIPHRGLVNYLQWCIGAYEVADGRGAPVHSPLAFDLTVTSLFSPLLTGRSVILLPEEEGVEALAGALRGEGDYSLVKITPAHLQALGQTLTVEEAKGRTRRLIIGGEALYEARLSFWRENAPDTVLINEYGPTETVVGCCVYEFAASEDVPHLSISGAVPIGRPIANTQLYILDEDFNPVPVGVAGELHVGGAGLARGYLNHPELTAAKFTPHPFSAEPGARLYQTGDLARYFPDGNIEFLGRRDAQVKIRGYRIEPGEVEAALKQHPAVIEAMIVARADTSGDARLVAYIVVPETQTLTVTQLRGFLHERLPEYMIPSAFMMLPSLPLTPNGKVDVRALPPPDTTRPALEKAYVSPRTEAESKLAKIWGEVLRLEQVGVHDNFFELGGDSILSLQVTAKANRVGLRLTPKQIFQQQTIAGLALTVEEAVSTEAEQGLVLGTLPLTPVQHWFFEMNIADPHHWNQAVLLEMKRAIEPAVLEQAVRILLTHHDALRLRFVRADSKWHQFIAEPGGPVPFERVDLSKLAEEKQRQAIELAASESQASLNLSNGPLLRVVLFDLGTQRSNRLLITIHHLAVDGVSWRILLEDLQIICEQLIRGEARTLPAKTNSFKQWSEKLEEHGSSETLQQELDHWLAQADTLTLPVDYGNMERSSKVSSSRLITVSLGVEETDALLHIVPKAYHTRINDALLTALAQSFATWTGARSLVIALEGHGREDIFDDVNLSRTVGWFTSIFPVRLELGESDEPGESLKTIKEQLRRIPRNGIGYGLLRYLADDAEAVERLRALPQPEVAFNYLGQFDQVFDGASLFAPAHEAVGHVASPEGTRPFLLEVNASVASNRLQVVWNYSEVVHRRSTIENLATVYIEKLRALIAHCRAHGAGGYTPSDFSAGTMNQQTLDNLLSRVARPAKSK